MFIFLLKKILYFSKVGGKLWQNGLAAVDRIVVHRERLQARRVIVLAQSRKSNHKHVVRVAELVLLLDRAQHRHIRQSEQPKQQRQRDEQRKQLEFKQWQRGDNHKQQRDAVAVCARF